VIKSLQERGLIKSMEYNAYTRIHHEDKEIKVVKQMPTIASNKQPTIAIITAQYCEKLAVDAMLENKETFVRYTTVGRFSSITNRRIARLQIANIVWRLALALALERDSSTSPQLLLIELLPNHLFSVSLFPFLFPNLDSGGQKITKISPLRMNLHTIWLIVCLSAI